MVQFHGPVRAPEGTVDGVARVTLSFPAWPGGRVAPVTLDIPVVAAPTLKR